ncbi:hypothetical protein SAMN05444064_1223 [Pseudomonas syringae]|uniref:hypothetical protein n=1 Tax=Pseudomonas syringae TaxID=317 RepID=UPI0008956F15|nr:hypothetical protein [Pseudomonas syringae]SDX45827.1 hypothetical protein SAMN05444514_1223 [Pseudomonas syringae]SFM59237.1 hypothetical protein SAMN05444064_1223 [Pseudomonas syringae]
MQIMFLISKRWRTFLFMWLALAVTSTIFASPAISWISNKNGVVRMGMADGSVYGLRLSPDVEGVFYDGRKHAIGDSSYVSVFQVSPSIPEKPEGFCGAGTEVWLYIYEVAGAELRAKTRILVSSCLRSISLASQRSGEEAQESDFSSVQWNEQGFSIEWFDHVDAAGRPLSSTNYVVRGNVFSPMEVLSKESLGE